MDVSTFPPTTILPISYETTLATVKIDKPGDQDLGVTIGVSVSIVVLIIIIILVASVMVTVIAMVIRSRQKSINHNKYLTSDGITLSSASKDTIGNGLGKLEMAES